MPSLGLRTPAPPMAPVIEPGLIEPRH
jgi:hypothetical protein